MRNARGRIEDDGGKSCYGDEEAATSIKKGIESRNFDWQ
jgi:hypothetical protein